MRILVLGGIAGPIVFSVIVFVLAGMRPEYSHLRNFISELGVAGTPYAAFMNYAGFVPAGLMLAAFGVALASVLPWHWLAIVAAVLVTLFGAGVAVSGVISCDPGCSQNGGSLENLMHNTIAPIAFLCVIAGAGVLGVHFRRMPAWRHLSVYSLLTSSFAFLLLVALANSLARARLRASGNACCSPCSFYGAPSSAWAPFATAGGITHELPVAYKRRGGRKTDPGRHRIYSRVRNVWRRVA